MNELQSKDPICDIASTVQISAQSKRRMLSHSQEWWYTEGQLVYTMCNTSLIISAHLDIAC